MRCFISYAHEDTAVAERLYTDLVAAGFDPWWDRRHFTPGADLDDEVLNAIRESRFFLLLLSETSVSKEGYIRKEVALAMKIAAGFDLSAKFIIPIRVEPCSPRPDEMAGLSQFIEAHEDWHKAVSQIASLLHAGSAIEGIDEMSLHELHASMASLEHWKGVAAQVEHASSIAVFIDNSLRRLTNVDEGLVGRKVKNISARTREFSQCLHLIFVRNKGMSYAETPDAKAACRHCNACEIVHGHFDLGGVDYYDNYYVLCKNCFECSHFEEYSMALYELSACEFDYESISYVRRSHRPMGW
jgi:hypothetical protein